MSETERQELGASPELEEAEPELYEQEEGEQPVRRKRVSLWSLLFGKGKPAPRQAAAAPKGKRLGVVTPDRNAPVDRYWAADTWYDNQNR